MSELESPKLNTAGNDLQLSAALAAGEAVAEAQHSAVAATRSTSRAGAKALLAWDAVCVSVDL